MPLRQDSDTSRRLRATEAQLRADREQLGLIWRRLMATQAVIEHATTVFKESRALLDDIRVEGAANGHPPTSHHALAISTPQSVEQAPPPPSRLPTLDVPSPE
ncbi:MAG TPA: hypothetical protein VKX28_10535 [Xanthobacteraceae bacterium]|nr:hypothetical protein [Xanthobacteraceae bacterium]